MKRLQIQLDEALRSRRPLVTHSYVLVESMALLQRWPSSLWWNPGERRAWPVLPAGARRPADKAREGGIPRVFRPKRNAERGEAERFSRDGSPGERRLGFTTGC